MNYNLNSFVLAIGEHLASITRAAPWINGQPITHEQAYAILSGVHEELFNEMFNWANIDNSVMNALDQVYQGFQVFAQGKPKFLVHRHGEWQIIKEVDPAEQYRLTWLPIGSGLPSNADKSYIYGVAGGRTLSDWMKPFVTETLDYVRYMLRNQLSQYLGTSLNYEWYYEYTSNGIIYNKQGLATINHHITHDAPVTEQEMINEAISMLPPVGYGNEHLLIDISNSENTEGIAFLSQQLQRMLIDCFNRASMTGKQRIDIDVKYTKQIYFEKVRSMIASFTDHLQVSFNVHPIKVESHSDLLTKAFKQLAVDFKSMTPESAHQSSELANQLTVIRDRIVRRNGVSQSDALEIYSLAPELHQASINSTEIARVCSDSTLWYLVGGVNPTTLNQSALVPALVLGNYIDELNGFVPANTPVNIPSYTVGFSDQPLSVTPMYFK